MSLLALAALACALSGCVAVDDDASATAYALRHMRAAGENLVAVAGGAADAVVEGLAAEGLDVRGMLRDAQGALHDAAALPARARDALEVWRHER